MRKFLCLFLMPIFLNMPIVHAGRGGAAFGGALAGSMLGSVVGSAVSRDSGSARRAEAEARRAQDQTAALRQEQQLRREIEMSRGFTVMQIGMFFGFIILLLIIVVLSILLFVRRKR